MRWALICVDAILTASDFPETFAGLACSALFKLSPSETDQIGRLLWLQCLFLHVPSLPNFEELQCTDLMLTLLLLVCITTLWHKAA